MRTSAGSTPESLADRPLGEGLPASRSVGQPDPPGHSPRQKPLIPAVNQSLTSRIVSPRTKACPLLLVAPVGRGTKCHGGACVLPTPGEGVVSAFPSPDSLATMVNSVTTTMMNVRFALARGSAGRAVFRRAVLPIPGTVPVSVVLACDEGSCRQLGAKLFCVKPGEVDVTMIEDTLRELANITAGQVKRAMALDQALGLPRSWRAPRRGPPPSRAASSFGSKQRRPTSRSKFRLQNTPKVREARGEKRSWLGF